MGINHKNRTFSGLYKAMKFICAALWALSQTHMTDFPTLSYKSRSKIPTLSYTSASKILYRKLQLTLRIS